MLVVWLPQNVSWSRSRLLWLKSSAFGLDPHFNELNGDTKEDLWEGQLP